MPNFNFWFQFWFSTFQTATIMKVFYQIRSFLNTILIFLDCWNHESVFLHHLSSEVNREPSSLKVLQNSCSNFDLMLTFTRFNVLIPVSIISRLLKSQRCFLASSVKRSSQASSPPTPVLACTLTATNARWTYRTYNITVLAA